MADGVGAVDGSDSFVVCSVFAPEGPVVVGPDEKLGLPADVDIVEVELSEAADVIDDMFKELRFQSA